MWCVCVGGSLSLLKIREYYQSYINHSNEVQRRLGELADSEPLETDNQLFNEAVRNFTVINRRNM